VTVSVLVPESGRMDPGPSPSVSGSPPDGFGFAGHSSGPSSALMQARLQKTAVLAGTWAKVAVKVCCPANAICTPVAGVILIVGLAVTVTVVEPDAAGSDTEVAFRVTVAYCRLSGIDLGAV